MSIICTIALATCTQLAFIVNKPVKGRIVNQNDQYYLVDFSKSKEAKTYCSDLTELIPVDKRKCFK